MNNTQKNLLQILLYFDSFCKKHNLKYHLAYGTLLGAVRHQGFIPWDDDIDVLMPLEDYNKLQRLATQIKEKFYLQSIDTDRRYFYLFSKILNLEDSNKTQEDILYGRDFCGCWIDIFPCINVPNIDSKIFKKWKKKRMFLSRILAIKSIPFKNAYFLKKIFKILFFIVPRGSIVKRLNKSSNNIEKFGKKGLFYPQDFWSPENRIILNNYNFNETIDLKFEDLVLPCPKNYNNVLTAYYGDYMTPPPLDKRGGHF